ncbi:MAG TPA: hypothetical protein VFE14_20340 [Micromonosporaceae bacterium]|jgi:hypothetical protein|nr:hypothetical protein [Micromonosporaceae bacterium]
MSQHAQVSDHEPVDDHDKRRRMITYGVLGLVLLGLLIWGLAAFKRSKDSQAAEDKAGKLIAAYQAAGLATPLDKDDVARLLGTDGGSVCSAPDSALRIGLLNQQLSNGAGGPGQRPVTVDSRVIKGQRLILQEYCPDKLAEFDEFVKGLKFADVADDNG